VIVGIGTDIASVSRIDKIYQERKNKFLERILSPDEINIFDKNQKIEFLAGRFAAKEAIIKAMGEKKIAFNEITILNNSKGKPYLANKEFLEEKYLTKIESFHISISHEKEFATAFVIVEG